MRFKLEITFDITVDDAELDRADIDNMIGAAFVQIHDADEVETHNVSMTLWQQEPE